MITKTCTVSGKEFVITKDDMKFYEKMGVPEPTLCPEERQRRRWLFRNERNLYHRQCDATKKRVISFYYEGVPGTFYERDYWWSDMWNPLEYGIAFDSQKLFFEQFQVLYRNVPKMAFMTSHCENSTYGPFGVYSKNCYMAVSCNHSEDVYYSYQANSSTDCVDCSLSHKLECCYDCFACENSFDLKYSCYSENCSSSYFLKNCRACRDCFGCVNLNNKQYCFLNKQYTKEEYEKKIAGLLLHIADEVQKLAEHFYKYIKNFSVKSLYGVQNESVSGNLLTSCKNAYDCYESVKLEDCRFVGPTPAPGAKSCYDTNYSPYAEASYECMSGVGNYGSGIMLYAWEMTDSWYCNECFSCQDCFGCVGLKKAQYCILNKQYTKDEYFKLKEKIIEHMKTTGEWGEFFPISMSPFGYNETVAQEYYPLTKEEVLAKGYKWKDEEPGAKYNGPRYNIPDDIKDVNNDILQAILTCEVTGKNYRIVKPELDFYRKMNLPIPRLCPDERHKRRMALRNPRKLWDRKCAECACDIKTTYAPERPEKVLCEECYLKEVN